MRKFFVQVNWGDRQEAHQLDEAQLGKLEQSVYTVSPLIIELDNRRRMVYNDLMGYCLMTVDEITEG